MSELLTTASRENQPEALREQYYKISDITVHQIPEQERPREMFDRLGPENIPDKQLIALILRSGVRGHNVVDIADGLLREYGSIATLAEVSVDDLARVRGMGKVRAQVLKAALELARRVATAPRQQKLVVRTPPEAMQALKAYRIAMQREFETFWVMLLNRRYQLCRPPLEITRGILDASLVHPREVFKEAIRSNSAALILVHNHPSGDPTPSAEDIRITRQLVEAGKIVQIDVLDHVIIGSPQNNGREYVSLRETGLVNFSG
jgi:DNA repair protein RadC